MIRIVSIFRDCGLDIRSARILDLQGIIPYTESGEDYLSTQIDCDVGTLQDHGMRGSLWSVKKLQREGIAWQEIWELT